MSDTGEPKMSAGLYRARYLKLKSVLEDRVTGLPVYTVLIDRLRILLDERRKLGVLHFEIGQLELVESLYGWQVIDRILERAARVMKEQLGGPLPEGTELAIDTVAGDRLMAFVPETRNGPVDAAWLARAGKEVEGALEREFDGEDFAGLNPRLTFRTGHSLLSENPYSRFERRVHAAIDEARRLPGKMERRREISSTEELKRIVSESAVSMVYHPVIELDGRSVVGYEALARGPEGSMFEMPRSMFALSGKAGVEAALDRVCRRAAIENCRLASGEGKLFVNVLAGSLCDPDWVNGKVGGQLRKLSLEPRDLVLELSERSADSEPDRIAEAIADLRSAGFGIALDDVGTGYSSLATLERIHPDYVKVDTSLVRGIEDNLIQQDALRSLVKIAGRLGSKVIAEGVETGEEAAALASIGVRYGQGFLFSRPVPMPGGMPRPGGLDH